MATRPGPSTRSDQDRHGKAQNGQAQSGPDASPPRVRGLGEATGAAAAAADARTVAEPGAALDSEGC